MFGKRLRQARMNSGYTQQALSDLVGLALRSYQCYETGTRQPSLDMLVKLADALDVPTDYLLERGLFARWDEVMEHKHLVFSALQGAFPGLLREIPLEKMGEKELMRVLPSFLSGVTFTGDSVELSLLIPAP